MSGVRLGCQMLSIKIILSCLVLGCRPCLGMRNDTRFIQVHTGSFTQLREEAAVQAAHAPAKGSSSRNRSRGEGCTKDLSNLFCCSISKNTGGCKDMISRNGVQIGRQPCPSSDASKNVACKFKMFSEKRNQCRCLSGHCWDADVGACVKKDTMTMAVGTDSVVAPPATTGTVKVVDMVSGMFKPKSGKSLMQEIADTAQDFGDTAEHIAGTAAAGAGTAAVGGGKAVLELLHTVLRPVIHSLLAGGTRFTGMAARQFMNMEPSQFTKWLQGIMAKFVLSHDDGPEVPCGTSNSLDPSAVKPDYGKCNYDLSGTPGPDLPIWDGPIFEASNGKKGRKKRDYQIRLAAKVGQIRELESLMVQKSECYGNMLAYGGFCDLELASAKNHPLSVTDVEITIYCQGSCYAAQHALAWLNLKEDFDVGDIVYIEKIKVKGWTGTTYADFKGRTLSGCNNKKVQGVIVARMLQKNWKYSVNNPSNMRYCIKASADGVHLGCWAPKNLILEAECGSARHAARRLVAYWAGRNATDHISDGEGKRPIVYRKFDLVLEDILVRARMYVHRTRSLEEMVDEEPDAAEKSRMAGVFQSFFKAGATVADAIRHPREWTMDQKQLVEQYHINVRAKTLPDGTVDGYELVSCSNPVWNEESQDYEPPLEKCLKLYFDDFSVLATRSDYLQVVERASSINPPEGVHAVMASFFGFYSHMGPAAFGFDNTGLLMALVAKLARMMFVRDVVYMNIGGKYCKDKWKEPWSQASAANEAQAASEGVKCNYDSLEEKANESKSDEGGVQAFYEFEIVELQPTWNAERKRNDMHIALRGGYNMQFCRVSASAQHEKVFCDLDVPVQEGTQTPVWEHLPSVAKFQVIHQGGNDFASTADIESTANPADASEVPACTGADCEVTEEEGGAEDVERQARAARAMTEDAGEVAPEIKVRLKNHHNNKYCTVKTLDYKRHMGMSNAKRAMMVCDETTITPATEITFTGNVNTITPSHAWDLMIKMSLIAIFGGGAWTVGKLGVIFGGATVVFTGVMVVTGVGVALAANRALVEHYHYDGIMIRFLCKQKMQLIGQYILFCIQSALVFEFPRP